MVAIEVHLGEVLAERVFPGQFLLAEIAILVAVQLGELGSDIFDIAALL